MSKMRLIATAGGTLACALGIGFVMQRTAPAPHPVATTQPETIAQSVLPGRDLPGGTSGAPLELQGITLTSARTDAEPPDNRPVPPMGEDDGAQGQTDDAILPATPADPEMPSLGCAVAAQALPAPMATVDLSISAPCLGNERVTVHHNGMIFSAVTDAGGQLKVTVPALAERAVFIAAFANGKGAVATTRVAGLNAYDRAVLQWAGDSGFQIHAREFGAGYGDSGHVWSGATAAAAQDGNSTGSVVRLGDETILAPLMAEVYSFPSGRSTRSGTVAISIEAEVNELNCGRDVSAQLLERHGSDALRTRDLVLSVPGCAAVGDFLVLNNLLDDLKIAAK